MAQTKKTRKKASARQSRAQHTKKNSSSERGQRSDSVFYQCLPFLLIVLAALLELCLIIPEQLGILGLIVSHGLFGLFSLPAFMLPALLVVVAVYLRRPDYPVARKAGYALICLLMLCVLLHAFSAYGTELNPKTLFMAGIEKKGGGAIGGFIGSLMMRAARTVGTVIIASAVLLLSGLLLFGFTPHSIWVSIRFYLKKSRERRAEQRADDNQRRYRFHVTQKEVQEGAAAQRRTRAAAASSGGAESADRSKLSRIIAENEKIIRDFTEKKHESADKTGQDMSAEQAPAGLRESAQEVGRIGDEAHGELDLDKIFADADFSSPEEPVQKTQAEDEALPDLSREAVGLHREETQKPEEPRREYILPPESLLKDPGKRSASAGEEEARANAIKLVKTLASFRVNTRISNISRGPTITRYELVPEEGVRVRSVANLVDDISLSLATEGVRIEAPIPGKSAIGIEVPNKNVATVYLRELIETEEFRGAKSKLTAALGMDVAGAPKYFDIAKMPHLLIAGATGMGKSVSINSILISLLYRATPDEVKLILIDPKKVELNIYNGLPHLLVPVVSHPKKAAGTLNWACIEMERRFELIEDVGVRDIGGYNEATKNDPDREFLPQIVIIIDELADLMMTAPDDVENSICRLAQKARAAGMHLIIGTQRPSVDVITGLIKANIPSRIAFTVASQVDSRTILDIAGAEKLIGRGDMLFAPVGCTKPLRIQGSFVSDSEVDAVVEFIKRQTGKVDYDQEVVEKIEKEAERCGTKKGGASDGGADAGEDDPRLMEALEIAVENGKISTSLLQRRMSVGYGKAAKLIDQLEARGYVGPLEGSKPREIRISKQQFMEMSLNKEEA